MRSPRGKINLIGLVLIAAVLGGFFWIINYAGAYLDNLTPRDAVRAAYNQAWNHSDGDLKHDIKLKCNDSTVGDHEEEDQFGNTKKVKGLGITDDDVTIDRDEVTKTINISVTYKRKIELFPWPNKNNVRWLTFSEHKSGPVKSPSD